MKYILVVVLIVLFPSQFLLCNVFGETGVFHSRRVAYEKSETNELVSYVDNYLNMLPKLLKIGTLDWCKNNLNTMRVEDESEESPFKNFNIKSSKEELIEEFRKRYGEFERYIFNSKDLFSGFIDENGMIHLLLLCESGRVVDILINKNFIDNFALSLSVKPLKIVLSDPNTGYDSILFFRKGILYSWMISSGNGEKKDQVLKTIINRRVVNEDIKIWNRVFKFKIYFPLFPKKTVFTFIGLFVLTLSSILLIGLIICHLFFFRKRIVWESLNMSNIDEKKLTGSKDFKKIIDEIDKKVELMTEKSVKKPEESISEEETNKTKKLELSEMESELTELEKDGIHIKKL